MGGKNIPASGFALYFDHLMDLVKPATLAKPLAQGVLINAEPKTIKQGFDMVSRLHEAGYVAEFELEAKEPAKFEWRLNIRSKAPLFVLTDQTKQRRFEAQTADEILALLRKGNVNKDSVA